jgi:hypothetical protein
LNNTPTDIEKPNTSLKFMMDKKINKDNLKNFNAAIVRKILSTLKKHRKLREKAVIIFHNDADGFCAALYIKQVLLDLKYILEPEDFIPITHLERDALKTDDDEKIYFFLDIQPKEFGENIFCIDHHNINGKKRYIDNNLLIYTIDSLEQEFMTTTTFLCMYFYYVHKNYRFNYNRFTKDRPWWKNEFDRYIAFFSTIADNLWLLSKYTPIDSLNNWIRDLDISERNLIKVSMGISLLLGRADSRLSGFDEIINQEHDSLQFSSMYGIVREINHQIDNLYRIARSLDREAKIFVTEQYEQVKDEIATTEFELDRDRKTIADYVKAMPIDLKKDIETALEIYKTVGNKDTAKWKQIEFYGKEIERLQIHVNSLENKLKALEKKKDLMTPENVPGICVFISKQSSEQVKGILSSLLYYFGQKNIVIEETEHHAIWGARGFTQETLEQELTTVIFDKNILESYIRIEDMSKDLPTSYRKSLNISHNITFERKYVGGMGGRGLVFGGNISGKVPQLFAMLDISGFEEKIQELIAHGELSKAIKGLTEGQSQVSTVTALRTKFKSGGWVTIQVIGGSGSGDILSDETGVPLAWLAGTKKQIDLSEKPLPEEQNNNQN